MKKWIALALCALLLLCGVTACGSSDDVLKIGILQFADFDALTQAQQGFIDGLKEAGYVDGENIKLNIQSAAADANTCPSIADSLVNDGSDLILAIATPSALALKEKTKTIPVLFTAVTDPTGADTALIASNDAPGGNLTGTSDMNPVAEQIDMLLKVLPDAKNVAVLYCSSESNSKTQYDLAKAALDAKSVGCVEKTIADINEAKGAVESLAGKVDAIYVPTDNTLANSMKAVSEAANALKLPVFSGEGGMVKDGAMLSYGISYYELGKMTAAQAVKILKGEAEPATMPVERQTTNLTVTVNTDTAKACGITIPDDIMQGAIVYPQ